MSFGHINWVFANAAKHDWSTGLQIVLLSLADMMDTSGKCYPSISCTAKRVSLSAKQVRRHIQTLKRLGLIKVIKNEKGGNPGETPVYQALFQPSDRFQSSRPPADGSRSLPLEASIGSHASPAGLPSMSVDPSHPREPNHHRTTIEPSLNQRKSLNKRELPKLLETYNDILVAGEILGLRHEIERLESGGEYTKRVKAAFSIATAVR